MSSTITKFSNEAFENILHKTQDELYPYLYMYAPAEDTYADDDLDQYILIEGKAPVMLVAHMDTVHREKCEDICWSKDGDIIMSPQGIGGDDRCGIYALLTIYEECKARNIPTPWLLFTCDEEAGGVGADYFVKDLDTRGFPFGLWKMKYLVEIDRRGATDAVFYDCANKDFTKYVESFGFREQYGSFSDISTIAPALGIAAVNLSSGYYNAHTLHEYIVVSELKATIEKVLSMIEESVKTENGADIVPPFHYVAKQESRWSLKSSKSSDSTIYLNSYREDLAKWDEEWEKRHWFEDDDDDDFRWRKPEKEEEMYEEEEEWLVNRYYTTTELSDLIDMYGFEILPVLVDCAFRTASGGRDLYDKGGFDYGYDEDDELEIEQEVMA